MMETTASTLIPKKKQESLFAWFELYLRIEAGDPESNTFKAKKRDLQKFVDFLQKSSGTDHPDQWTKSVTKSFLRHLYKKRELAASTVNRALATLKHVAGWIHHQRPFLVGNPCERVKSIDDYIHEERGRSAGPLFQSKNGNRLAPQNVDDALKKIAAQANSTLPKKEQIHLSAHMLRHTCLRKAAEKDIRYAMKLSSHTSSQYIWRYTEPSATEFDQAMEDLYD